MLRKHRNSDFVAHIGGVIINSAMFINPIPYNNNNMLTMLAAQAQLTLQ